jgi:hypothetical protein
MTVTPYSYREYTGNGTNRDFQVPFPYLLKAHVKVYTGLNFATGAYTSLLVDGTDYSWTSTTSVQLTTAPAAGIKVTVRRETPTSDLLTQWQDGSTLIAEDLLTSDKQNLYAVQEGQDRNDAGIAQSTATVAASQSAVAASAAAVQTANAAESKADSAAAAIGAFGVFTPVATVANIPAAPTDGQAVQVTDSTGIESFTPLANVPAGFVGDPGVYVRIQYSQSLSTWSWFGYSPADPDSRYQASATSVKLNQAQTFTAQQTFTELKETVFTLGTSGVVNIDPANGSIQRSVLTGTVQFVDALENGQSVSILIENASTYVVQWPTVTWVSLAGNAAPALTAKDVLTFWKAFGTLFGNLTGSYA